MKMETADKNHTEIKYDMRICKCGRIHMIDYNKLDKALENNKNLLLICGGCGNATLIGADITADWDDPDGNCYMIYSNNFSLYGNKSITANDFKSTEECKGIEEIIYSHGLTVPMMTGMNATDFDNGNFFDRWHPDFWKIQRNNITVEEIMDFIDKYMHDRTTVDMNRFIHETPEDMLEEISRYSIDGLNWKGTKWETRWNSK